MRRTACVLLSVVLLVLFATGAFAQTQWISYEATVTYAWSSTVPAFGPSSAHVSAHLWAYTSGDFVPETPWANNDGLCEVVTGDVTPYSYCALSEYNVRSGGGTHSYYTNNDQFFAFAWCNYHQINRSNVESQMQGGFFPTAYFHVKIDDNNTNPPD